MTPHEITVPPTCICGDLLCEIPFGLCHCGCREKTNPATRSSARNRIKRGQSQRFLRNHEHLIAPILIAAAPFKIDGVYCRLIPLTRGQYTIVDAADYEWLMQWNWQAHWDSKAKGFYVSRSTKLPCGTRYFQSMHRQILGLGKGDTEKGDHISGVTLDNRRLNLRKVDHIKSTQNRGRPVSNKSGFTGVTWHRLTGKWLAQIRADGKHYHLGLFDTPESANDIRMAATEKYHGEFARKF